MRDVNSFFSKNPTSISNISRSIFDRTQDIKLTFNSGLLIPFYYDEVLPGDTFSIDTSILCRMSTPIHPVMDDCFLDIYYFFVPNRLVWDHWEEFNGSNDDSWSQTVEYEIPQLVAPIPSYDIDSLDTFVNGCFYQGSVGDYFGLPTNVHYPNEIEFLSTLGDEDRLSVSALPFRAYGLIWNEWFRDQNLQDSLFVPKDDSTRFVPSWADIHNYYLNKPDKFAFNGSYSSVFGGMPAPVAKFHDYFTSALPTPQKGPNVPLPVEGTAYVYGRDNSNMILQGLDQSWVGYPPAGSETGETITGTDYAFGVKGIADRAGTEGSSSGSMTNIGLVAQNVSGNGSHTNSVLNQTFGLNLATKAMVDSLGATSAGLYADINAAIGTINDLRLAFAIQKLYERDARGGTRYRELIYSHFGVTTADSRVQVPEYLGGKRVHINMSQVLQTSSTDDTSPQGNTAAFSLTTDHSDSFTKSFTEHGMVIGVLACRPRHTYQYGIEKSWLRKNRFDFYWPALANIGELPIQNQEIYFSPDKMSINESPFGYQEAWAEYRYKPSRISGAFRNNWLSGSLDVWHYADVYDSLPHLSSDWIRETSTNIDRTLAVSSSIEHQFIADIQVKQRASRPMPLYSVPGLIDHN